MPLLRQHECRLSTCDDMGPVLHELDVSSVYNGDLNRGQKVCRPPSSTSSESFVASAIGDATIMSDCRKSEYSFTAPLQQQSCWHAQNVSAD